MYMWDCIMILLYYTCYVYFIMIMILLVTAYNGIAKKGEGKGRSNGYTQGYSKYFRRPCVRTASGWRHCWASPSPLLMDAASDIGYRHTPSGAAGDCSE